MKRLCCSKLIWLALFWALGLHAALTSKSAALYYGKEISYPTVGIHNYVFAEPDNIVTASHGYKVYGSKIYVKVDPYRISAAKKPSKSAWIYKRDSVGYIMDMRNDLYRTHVVKTLFADLMKRGFKNFYIDSLDIYQETAASKKEQEEFGEANIKLLEELRREYPKCKFIVKGGEDIIEKIHSFLEAVVIDSYMYGLDKDGFRHTEVSQERQKRVDRFIEKLKSYKLDIVTVEYTNGKSENEKSKIAEQLAKKGLIPVIVDSATVYSSTLKSAKRREILVLIDETQMDRIFLSPHQHGTLPLEFYGYKVKFYEVSKGLPPIEDVAHYAGVIVWIIDTYKEPREFIDWVLKITQNGTKIAFANNFGIHADQSLISPLGIEIHSGAENYGNKHQISYRDKMIGYEVEPSSINTGLYYQPANAKALLIFEDTIGVTSTPAAIMPWGGYAMSEAFMMELKEENIWIINPFEFFKEALRLEPILVPDATTENGRRLLFTHV
ncbi:MAG: endo alpha-1,4 polygalactosaminidase, partial [Epsilonproteobacteria bacterium]|nr:endo alpha-1,4 polygalactosaminidase [Campylobacterota bacterium]